MLRNYVFVIVTMALLTSCFSTMCHAQNHRRMEYGYDTNGNRISYSKIRFDDFTRGERDADERYVNEVSELFAGMQVKLFPNPTSDKFMVSVDKGDSGAACAILTTMTGVVLEEKALLDGTVEFDLTGRSPGIYLLKLTVNGASKTWKVLKNQP